VTLGQTRTKVSNFKVTFGSLVNLVELIGLTLLEERMKGPFFWTVVTSPKGRFVCSIFPRKVELTKGSLKSQRKRFFPISKKF